MWFWLAGLAVIFGAFNPYFFTLNNLQNIMVQATVLGLLVFATSMSPLVAEIDLSVTANLGSSSVVGTGWCSGVHVRLMADGHHVDQGEGFLMYSIAAAISSAE